MAQICCVVLGIAGNSKLDEKPNLLRTPQAWVAHYDATHFCHADQARYRSALQMGLPASDCLREGPQNDQLDRRERPDTFPKFDEYGDLPFTREKQRLDYFAQELTSIPEEPAYIIEYRSKRQNRKPLARAKRARDYLVRVKGIDANRIQVVNGGYRKEFKIELRLGPAPLK